MSPTGQPNDLFDSGGTITVSSLGDPDKGLSVVFGVHGPTDGYIDKTWVIDDIEKGH